VRAIAAAVAEFHFHFRGPREWDRASCVERDGEGREGGWEGDNRGMKFAEKGLVGRRRQRFGGRGPAREGAREQRRARYVCAGACVCNSGAG
jgi:hypothetical protein